MEFKSIPMIIKTRRDELGISQRELARRAGVSYRAVALIEKGQRRGRTDTINKILAALGLGLEVRADAETGSQKVHA